MKTANGFVNPPVKYSIKPNCNKSYSNKSMF